MTYFVSELKQLKYHINIGIKTYALNCQQHTWQTRRKYYSHVSNITYIVFDMLLQRDGISNNSS